LIRARSFFDPSSIGTVYISSDLPANAARSTVSSTAVPTLLTVTVNVPVSSVGATNLGGATGQIGAFCRENWACVFREVMTIYTKGIRNTISRIVVNVVTKIEGKAFANLGGR
jgi:hypothetical protein